MTDLSLLTVSLTKHNAHKLAPLLKKYGPQQVLSKLDEVHAEVAQARKNLSVQPGDKVPKVWDKAKVLGDDAIDALLLISIIFSHHVLIDTMIQASSRAAFSGRIERGKPLSGKQYTNFVRIIDQLGYATTLNHLGVTFDFRPMFEIAGLGPLVQELLELKLSAARWDRSNTLVEELGTLRFNDVFGLKKSELAAWLSTNAVPVSARPALLAKDQDYFQDEDEGATSKPFSFRSGHVERAVAPLNRNASAKTKASQLHNDIQNRLYKHLQRKVGEGNVGTEVETGLGTLIDVVTKEGNNITFYEIKTNSSARACIRQAVPQLLEYAFWPDENRAQELVIVSHVQITKTAEKYLAHLRKRFSLPVSYRQFSIKDDKLI
ncbi:MAG: hypothetical protein ACYC7G_06090 [Rudaea sp.]